MKKGGTINLKRKAYEAAVEILRGYGLSPLFDLETYQTKREHRQMVRCDTCGHEYGALIHKTRTTPCPNCAHRARQGVLDGYYTQALETVRARGYEPLFSRAEFRGFKEAGKYIAYPVRCTKCQAEVAVSVHPQFIKNCPACSSKLHQSYRGFLESCATYNFTALTPFEEWHGHKRVNSRVRCNYCGAEFEMVWRPEQKMICRVCHANRGYRRPSVRPDESILKCAFHKTLPHGATQAQRNAFIAEALDAQGLIPLFDVAANELPISYITDGHTHHTLFPVRCRVCGREFTTAKSRKKDTYFRKCTCQKTANVYICNREKWMRDYLTAAGIEYTACDRDTLKGTEVDILIPSMGIAFEFNGTFFHSTSSKNPSRKAPAYHAQKTSLALANGIKLYHIWEDIPEELAKSIIEAKLGRSTKIYARALTYTDAVPRARVGQFFAANHVDGNNPQAQVFFALTAPDGTIYCALSLLRRRLQRAGTFQWEIGRFANLRGYTVVGGYSRLLRHATAYLRAQGVTTLVSYCNRDLSPDPAATFYAKQGFELIGDSGPIYWYVSQRPIEINGRQYSGRIARQAVQKHKLLQHYHSHGLPVYPEDTERTLAERLRLIPNYNSGNFRFELKL